MYETEFCYCAESDATIVTDSEKGTNKNYKQRAVGLCSHAIGTGKKSVC